MKKKAFKFALEALQFYYFDNFSHFELVDTYLIFVKKSKQTAL